MYQNLKIMIYLTILLFIKEGQEEVFNQYENEMLPLMKGYNGKIIYRIRPEKESYIYSEEEKPYEIHFVSFESEADFQNYLKDKRRSQFLHLKEESIKSTMLVKGEQL